MGHVTQPVSLCETFFFLWSFIVKGTSGSSYTALLVGIAMVRSWRGFHTYLWSFSLNLAPAQEPGARNPSGSCPTDLPPTR